MADKLAIFMCRLSRNLGASTFWNPQGLSRPVQGLLTFTFTSVTWPLVLENGGRGHVLAVCCGIVREETPASDIHAALQRACSAVCVGANVVGTTEVPGQSLS
jgi:hypothetical protein